MRKKIGKALIVITLFLFLNNYMLVNASENIFSKDENLAEIMNGVELENFNKIQEEGTTSTNGDTRQENASIDMQNQSGSMPFLLKLLCRLLLAIPQVLNATISQIAGDGKEMFTIEGLLTNEYDLLNIKYIIQPDKNNSNSKSILGAIGENTAGWFVGIRNIAMVGSVISLIYVGIRLAIASVARDKSELKRMLLSWFEAVIILLLIQVFIVFMINLSDFAVETLKKTIEKNTGVTETLEKRIMNNINDNLDRAYQTRTTIFYSVLYIMFAYYQIKFFFLYLVRLLKVSFFIIISPLVCLTYPIDKVGDGTAQGFKNWTSEFMFATLMQPIHLLIYLIMIYSMGEIYVRNPILGIAFLGLLSHAEKTFKNVLNHHSMLPHGHGGLGEVSLKITQ